MATYYLLSIIDIHTVSCNSLGKYGHNNLLWLLIKFMPAENWSTDINLQENKHWRMFWNKWGRFWEIDSDLYLGFGGVVVMTWLDIFFSSSASFVFASVFSGWWELEVTEVTSDDCVVSSPFSSVEKVKHKSERQQHVDVHLKLNKLWCNLVPTKQCPFYWWYQKSDSINVSMPMKLWILNYLQCTCHTF